MSSTSFGRVRTYASHGDPLAEAGNWAALLIGSNLPFWPLYVGWVAGAQAFPTAILTVCMAPVFLLVPLVSRWSGLLGRIAMLLTSTVNTVFATWILGENTGIGLFFMPCGALAAMLFRRSERGWMVLFTLLPLAVWYGLQGHGLLALHHYDEAAARRLVMVNAISIGALMTVFGWLLGDVYQRMEKP